MCFTWVIYYDNLWHVLFLFHHLHSPEIPQKGLMPTPRPTSSSRTLARGFSSAPFSNSHSARLLLETPAGHGAFRAAKNPHWQIRSPQNVQRAFAKTWAFHRKFIHVSSLWGDDSLIWYHHGTRSQLWWSDTIWHLMIHRKFSQTISPFNRRVGAWNIWKPLDPMALAIPMFHNSLVRMFA